MSTQRSSTVGPDVLTQTPSLPCNPTATRSRGILKSTSDLAPLLETGKAPAVPRVKYKTFQHRTLGLSQPDPSPSCHSDPHTKKHIAATTNLASPVGHALTTGPSPTFPAHLTPLFTLSASFSSLPGENRSPEMGCGLKHTASDFSTHTAPHLELHSFVERARSLPAHSARPSSRHFR